MNSRTTIDVIHEDDSIVVICKEGGMLSVPGRGPEKQDCVAARLRYLFPEMIAQPAVHRLDMYTSGLMVFAKTAEAHRFLSIQFQKRAVRKKYIALVEGCIAGDGGEIRLSFRLDPHNRPLQIYDPVYGKPGVTLWRRLSLGDRVTRVEFTPITGRTHQLRVHAADVRGLNAPIVGDSLYGRGREGDPMMLHASFLAFFHPATGNLVEFTSPAPF